MCKGLFQFFNMEEVASWLSGVSSPDPAIRSQCEQKILKAEETHLEMYVEALIAIILQETESSALAAILVKKALTAFWMKPGALSETFKYQLRVCLVNKLPTIKNEQAVKHWSEALSQICVAEVIYGKNLPPYPSDSTVPYCCITLDLIVNTLNNLAEEGEDADRFSSLLSQFSGSNGFVLMILQYARRLLLPLHLAIKYLIESHKETFLDSVPADSIKHLIGLVCEKWSFAMVILTDILEDEDTTYENEQEAFEEQELITRLSEVCSVSMRLLRRVIGLGFTLSETSKHSTEEISPDLHKAMEQFAELQQSLFDGRKNPRATIYNNRMKTVLEKQLVNATKAVKELVASFPLHMTPYLRSILLFYLPIVISSPSINSIPEYSFERKFLVYALHCFTVSFEVHLIFLFEFLSVTDVSSRDLDTKKSDKS